MENIILLRASNNEDPASLGIIHNENMEILESFINELISNSSQETTGIQRNKLIMKTSETQVRDSRFIIDKVVSTNKATFTITSVDNKESMELVICEVRTFSNEKILCPIKYSKNSIIIEIDNIDDIKVTNVINPDNDVNNKIFILI